MGVGQIVLIQRRRQHSFQIPGAFIPPVADHTLGRFTLGLTDWLFQGGIIPGERGGFGHRTQR
jgi:hypothetical protein